MDERHIDSANTDHTARRRGVVAALVYVFEQVMPDPFVLSIGLTLVVSLLAVAFAPHNSLPTILTSWYDGTFAILGFALQMILILATGYAIADAPVVQQGLRAMAAGVPTPARATPAAPACPPPARYAPSSPRLPRSGAAPAVTPGAPWQCR